METLKSQCGWCSVSEIQRPEGAKEESWRFASGAVYRYFAGPCRDMAMARLHMLTSDWVQAG
jgi:hypothetical protein